MLLQTMVNKDGEGYVEVVCPAFAAGSGTTTDSREISPPLHPRERKCRFEFGTVLSLVKIIKSLSFKLSQVEHYLNSHAQK